WKKQPHLAYRKQTAFLDVGSGLQVVWFALHPAQICPLMQHRSQSSGHLCPTRHMKMRLDRKKAIRCLNEVSVRHTSHRICHMLLVGKASNVFNYGVGETEIKLSRCELT